MPTDTHHDGGEEADDQHHDHQLDEGEAALLGRGFSRCRSMELRVHRLLLRLIPVSDVGARAFAARLVVRTERIEVVLAAVRAGEHVLVVVFPRILADALEITARTSSGGSTDRWAAATSAVRPWSVVGYFELSSRNMVSAVSMLARSCFALATRAWSTLSTTLGTITAASSPMMTTTTMISMRVKPRARCRARVLC